jgi:hypothetical protein
MGVGITAAGQDFHLGPYAAMQWLRENGLAWTLKLLDMLQTKETKDGTQSESDDEDEDQDPVRLVREELECWLAPHQEPQYLGLKINYRLAFETQPDIQFAMAKLGLLGVFWFVAHSDCDGGWSTGQAADIASWIRLMKPLMLVSDDTSGTVYSMAKTTGYWQKVCSVFDAAVAHKTVVEIC